MIFLLLFPKRLGSASSYPLPRPLRGSWKGSGPEWRRRPSIWAQPILLDTRFSSSSDIYSSFFFLGNPQLSPPDFFFISVQWAAFAAAVWTLSELLPGTRTLLEKRVLSLLASGLVFSGPLLFHRTAGPEVFALHLLFVSLFC